MMHVQVHLIDGTYELFRHHSVLPSEVAADSRGAATRGVMRSVLDLLAAGATHVGVATDTVIESFRNDLWPGYKTGAGIDPALLDQFPLVERALEALGVTVWPHARGGGRRRPRHRRRARRGGPPGRRGCWCARPTRTWPSAWAACVVQLDRRAGTVRDAAGVREKFGVGPESIPDYLGLVGDSADGFPGLPGWGAKSAAAVLARYVHLEAIPDDEARVGRDGARSGPPGGDAARGPRGGRALPDARHPARATCRGCWRTALTRSPGAAPPTPSRACARRSARPSSPRAPGRWPRSVPPIDTSSASPTTRPTVPSGAPRWRTWRRSPPTGPNDPGRRPDRARPLVS